MSAHTNAVVFATDATYLPIAWTAAKAPPRSLGGISTCCCSPPQA